MVEWEEAFDLPIRLNFEKISGHTSTNQLFTLAGSNSIMEYRMQEEQFKPIVNEFESTCFGCSSKNNHGLKMEFKAGFDSVISELVVPDHLCGWSQLVHGGVLTTILDEVMSWTAMHFLKQLVMTKSMQLTFLKPVYVNKPILAQGKIIEKKRRHEVHMEGVIYNESKIECVHSEAVFAHFPPKLAGKLGIKDGEYPAWFSN